jgi:hypothetical protein
MSVRALGRRAVHDIIEIGRRLIDAKRIAGRGGWLPWLEEEFGWSHKTALNYMQVADAHGSGKFEPGSNFNVPMKGLYLLAAPSTPAELIDAGMSQRQATQELGVHHSTVAAGVAESPPKKGGKSATPTKRKAKPLGRFAPLSGALRAALAQRAPQYRGGPEGDGPRHAVPEGDGEGRPWKEENRFPRKQFQRLDALQSSRRPRARSEARVSVLIKRFLASKFDLPLGGHLRGRQAFA